MARAELVVDCQNIHGEGIQWNARDNRVWWTDIHGQQLWWLDPATGVSGSFAAPGRICCFAPRERGGFIVALAERLAFFDPETGGLTSFYEFEPENPHTRLNDGRTDRRGRFIVGGMNEGSGAADSSVLCVDPDGTVRTLFAGVACANSTCFSPDGDTMYFADTPERRIRAYPYDQETGELGPPMIFADLAAEPALPDGSCVDAEGGVWNAEWDGGRVVRLDPRGRVDRVVELPVGKVTCCAFGGEGLDTLFITTSRLGSTEDTLAAEPLAGGVFAFRPGVCGLTDSAFAG